MFTGYVYRFVNGDRRFNHCNRLRRGCGRCGRCGWNAACGHRLLFGFNTTVKILRDDRGDGVLGRQNDSRGIFGCHNRRSLNRRHLWLFDCHNRRGLNNRRHRLISGQNGRSFDANNRLFRGCRTHLYHGSLRRCDNRIFIDRTKHGARRNRWVHRYDSRLFNSGANGMFTGCTYRFVNGDRRFNHCNRLRRGCGRCGWCGRNAAYGHRLFFGFNTTAKILQNNRGDGVLGR